MAPRNAAQRSAVNRYIPPFAALGVADYIRKEQIADIGSSLDTSLDLLDQD